MGCVDEQSGVLSMGTVTQLPGVTASGGQSLFLRIYQAYNEGSLQVPSIPEVALRIQQASSREDTGIDDLATIVQQDPAIAAKMLHVANSPAYRSYSRSATVKDAVSRLGMNTTRHIAMALAMREVFQARDEGIAERMKALWKHSVDISSLAFVVARGVSGLVPETALLCGLIHDIGVVSLLAYADAMKVEFDERDFTQTVKKFRATTGAWVLKHWDFDPMLVRVTEQCERWNRNTGRDPDYVDVVIMAQLLDMYRRQVPWPIPHPMGKLALRGKCNIEKPDADGNLAFLQETAEDVAGLSSSLMDV